MQGSNVELSRKHKSWNMLVGALKTKPYILKPVYIHVQLKHPQVRENLAMQHARDGASLSPTSVGLRV